MSKVYQLAGAIVASATNETIISAQYNHLVVAFDLFTDSTKSSTSTLTAGSIVVEGKVKGAGGWSALDLSPLDATDKTSYATTSIPLESIRITQSADIAGTASFYVVTVTANDH
tara:strand:- start:72878 stop:73219 length:342 start_codon:yes stop_codon:yes gene_type:complete